MSLIANYWQRAECIFGIYGCDEPPMDGRDVCKTHEHCSVSSTGSHLDAEAAS